jgi:tripartite-type tricarboxylate transporter receptor subunit TctC
MPNHRGSRPRRTALIAALLLCLANVPCLAWPDRSVRIVTPAGAGGGSDAVLRIVADGLAKLWKQPVVVENRPGADGIVAIADFIQVQGEHTLLFAWTGVVTANPLLHERLPYDPIRDLLPVSFAVEDIMAVAAVPTLTATSLRELVALASGRPGAINYAAAPGEPYLGFVKFQKSTGIDLRLVPYRNPIASVTDLVAGRIEVAIMPLAVLVGKARAGTLRLLALASETRSPNIPEIPTAAEQGYPSFTIFGGLGFFAPKGTDMMFRQRIAADVGATLSQPNVRERLIELGYRPRGSGPAEFAGQLAEQTAKLAEVARVFGSRASQ